MSGGEGSGGAGSGGEAAGRPVALVTGGRRGIGRGIALALAGAGFDVAVADLPPRDEPAEALLSALAERGARGAFLPLDVADLGAHGAALDAARDALGPLDCLVNNAGVTSLARGDLLDLSPGSYDRVMAVNLRGAFFLTQAAARRMVAEAAGPHPRSVVFVTSANAGIVAVERGDYCLSKTAASMMAKLYATRLGPHGIAVHEVRPGVIATEMTAPARARYDALIGAGFTPLDRWGTPEDVGAVVAALASGRLPFVTGAAIPVDGGMHLHRLSSVAPAPR